MPETVETYEDGVLVATETVEVAPQAVNQRAQQDRAIEAISSLRQLKNTTGNLSSAQVSNAVRLFAAVLLALVRMAYGRFEEDD
jgi:hypothetical protein